MTQTVGINNTTAPLRNVVSLMSLIERCMGRSLGMPGMACFSGPSGYGKSMAAIWATNSFGAIYVQCGSSWTKRTLCERMMREIGVKSDRLTVADMIEQIAKYLAMNDVPLLIDEADIVLKRNMIEIVREIYEGSGATVILIGEEELPGNLVAIERVHGRMMDWVRAEPGTLDDIGSLAKIYADGVAVEKGLQKQLLDASHGSIRRICVNLARIQEFAILQGLDRVGESDWGKRKFFTGEAPAARKGLL